MFEVGDKVRLTALGNHMIGPDPRLDNVVIKDVTRRFERDRDIILLPRSDGYEQWYWRISSKFLNPKMDRGDG